jgi:hypothetical protein
MRSLLRRRPRAAHITWGATGLAMVAALAVVMPVSAGPANGRAAGTGSRAVLASAQRPGTTVSAATRRQLASISSQVNSLIGKMTLAEKVGQLEMSGPTGPNGTPGQTLLDEVRSGEVGSVLDLVGVGNINQVQQAALQSRLKIPVIFSLDVIHGYKTIFPVPLGEASSWDPAAVQNDASISASEATADGIKWTFNPMVDISRDPRWGRVVEGSGEDPFLGSAMAAAKVKGYQGNDFSALDKMAATVKHFGAYGAVVAGREYNTTDMSEQQLRNVYLPPYKAAVDAGAATVMSAFPISYNELPTGRPADPNNKYTSKYLDVPNTPQYAFGYGLSYTSFSLASLHLSAGSISTSGTLTVSADITNTGSVAGDDVVQLYTHQDGTSILQPVRRLNGFQRITLAPGQTKTVTFTLGPSNIGFYTNNPGQFVVEPGAVDVYVGDSSLGGLHGQFTVH